MGIASKGIVIPAVGDVIAQVVENTASVNALLDGTIRSTPPNQLTLIPENLTDLVAIKQSGGVTCNITPNDLFDVSLITNAYYVDVSKVDNSGDGRSWATAKKSIRAAIDAANSSGQPSRIAVRANTYAFPNSFNTTGVGVTSQVPLYIYSVYGRSLTGTFTETSTFTKTSGQDFVYEAARTNCNNVYNPNMKQFYKGVASVVECNSEAGTFYTDNVTLWVHPHTSSPATRKNCLPVLNANGCIFIGNHNVMLSGFDFIGGMAGAVTFSGGVNNTCILDECTASGAVGGTYSARTPQNGVSVIGCGLVAAFNSDASYNSKDGFGFSKNASDIRPFALLVNCSGYENGKTLPNAVSCNGFTMHDGCHGIDIGGTWLGSVGVNAGHVGDGTTVWHFGSTAGMSEGDAINGGSISVGGFGAWAGTAKIYLESCLDKSSTVGVYAETGGVAYLRNHKGTGRRIGDVNDF